MEKISNSLGAISLQDDTMLKEEELRPDVNVAFEELRQFHAKHYLISFVFKITFLFQQPIREKH